MKKVSRVKKVLAVCFLGAVSVLGYVLLKDIPIMLERRIPSAELGIVSPHHLRESFGENHDRAEARYGGKIVLVEGIVLSAGMSRYMTPNVVLSDRVGGEVQVICVFPRLYVGKLSGFSPGQNAQISGKVYSYSEQRGVVVMKECRIAE